jgi:hypothetical protein
LNAATQLRVPARALKVDITSPITNHRMGIDIYAEWDGMTAAEQKAQISGFSVDRGLVGYLREAYHGGGRTSFQLCRLPTSQSPQAANGADHRINIGPINVWRLWDFISQ